MQHDNLWLIGYGEVGKIFASGLKNQVAGVQTCASLQALCEHSDFIISAVTAPNTLADRLLKPR